MSSPAQRLADAVLQRRADLDVTQLDVWQANGPSNTTLTNIEKGATTALTRTTARKLDAGLQWAPGSARRVWEGGEPTPLEGVGGLTAAQVAEVESAGFSEETKRYILEQLANKRPEPPDRPIEAGEVG